MRFTRPAACIGATLLALLAACSGDATMSAPEQRGHGPLAATATDALTGASLTTSQDDYSPGEVVHLIGTGWAPGEVVSLDMTEDPDTHEDVRATVTADSTGAFSLHFYDVQNHDIGVTFTLTATGAESKSSATVVFRDGNINVKLDGSTTATTFTWRKFAGTTCGGTPTNSGSASVSNGNTTLVDAVANQSVEITAPATSGGVPFASWSNNSGTSTSLVFCVAGANSTVNSTALYAAPASAGTTTALTSSANPSVTGQLVTFTATVKAGLNAVSTGTVTFRTGGSTCADGTVAASNVALDGSGVATVPLALTASQSPLAVYACYSGASGFDGSNGSLSQTINQAATTTTVSDAPASSNVGQSVTFTAVVAATAPGSGSRTGTVTFYEFTGVQSCSAPGGASSLGAASLDATASASLSVSTLGAGNHTISACYGGDANFAASGGSDAHAVSLNTTTTAVTSSLNASTYGQSVTFDVTVSAAAGAGTPTGTVTLHEFTAGGTCAAPNGTLLSTITLNAGAGSYATNALVAGSHTVTACFSGSATFSSSDNYLVQGVNKAPLTITASSGSKTYGGTFNVTPSYSGFVLGQNASALTTPPVCSSTGSAAGAGVGGSPYATSCSGATAANYDIGYVNGSLTVDRAPLTITASSGTKTFGTVYTVTPSYGGFVNSENTSVLTSAPTCSSAGSVATATVAASPYVTSCSGAAAANYTIGYTNGSLIVTAAVTTLVVDAPVATQYSDKIRLSAKVTPPSPFNGESQSGSVQFAINGTPVGSGVSLSADGATTLVPNTYLPGGAYSVTASFTSSNANFSNAVAAAKSLTITKENASITSASGNVGAIPVSQTSVSLTFTVKETTPEPSPSPDTYSQAAAGEINNVTGLTAKLIGVAGSASYNGTCSAAASAAGLGYNGARVFTCVFSSGGTPFDVDAYTIDLDAVSSHYTASDEDVISVYDPSLGFVTGGGKFTDSDGTRVSFGMSFTYTGKGKTGFRGGWVVVKHLADGGVCRVKSNSMSAPAVNGTTASLSGKTNYTCVDANGVTTASAGNISAVGYVEDNGTSGAGQDKFWIDAYGTLKMPSPAVSNAKTLSGGNIQVPQPSR